MIEVRFVDLASAEPDEAVVVIDVLRAFTVEPWLFHQGVERIVAVAEADHAIALRDGHLPGALLAGEHGGRPLEGFDLGNSPAEVAAHRDLTGTTVLHRTSAGTQGLVRTMGSGTVFVAGLVNASATAAALLALGPRRVRFVVTGASLGRDGDEDLAAAELIAARMVGEDLDLEPVLRRVRDSDAGRMFMPGGPDWAPPEDLRLACEVDRFDDVLVATPAGSLPLTFPAVEVGPP